MSLDNVYVIIESAVYNHRVWVAEHVTVEDAIVWCRGIASQEDSHHDYLLYRQPFDQPIGVRRFRREEGRYVGYAKSTTPPSYMTSQDDPATVWHPAKTQEEPS